MAVGSVARFALRVPVAELVRGLIRMSRETPQ